MAIISAAPQSLCNMSVVSRVRCNHLFLNAGPAGFATASTTTDKRTNTTTTIPKPVLAVERVPSAFMLFRKEQSAVVKKESPNVRMAEALKNKWNALTSSKKEVYIKKSGDIAKGLMEKHKDVEKLREKLADFVKRPPGPYAVFIKDKVSSAPGKTAADRMQKVAAEWKNLKTEQKQKYVSKADVMKKEFEKRQSGLTEVQKNALTELRNERLMKKLKRLGRSNRNKELSEFATKYGRPKKPEPATGLYRADIWSTIPKGTPVSRMQTVASKWNALPHITKQKYIDKARANMDQYKKDLAAWEKKMVASGHKDVVEKFHKFSFRAFLPKNVKIPDEQRRKAIMQAKLRGKRAAIRQRDLERMKAQKARMAALKVKKVKQAASKKAKMAAQKAKMEKQRAMKQAKMAALKAKRAMKVKKPPKKGRAIKKAVAKKTTGAKKSKAAAKSVKKVAQAVKKSAKTTSRKVTARKTIKGKKTFKIGKARK